MSKILTAILLVTCIASANVSAEEKKLAIVGSMDFAFKNLSLDVGASQKMTAPLSTINPNLVLSYGNLYTSLGYNGAIGSSNVMMVDGNLPSVLNMSRSDFLLTVGYRLIDPVSVFGGWLKGNINALQSGVREPESGPPTQWYVQDIQYGTQGPFLGAAYSMALGQRSSLSFSAAYAKLAGTMTQTVDYATAATTTNSDRFDVSGLSYGVTFSSELADSLGYRVGLKNTRYAGDPTMNNPNGIIEQYTSFFIGISNYF